MKEKAVARQRRARKTQERIKRQGYESNTARLNIYRSSQHIYGQIIAPIGGKILACASSVDKSIQEALKATPSNKTETAKLVGKLLAQRAKDAGVGKVASDRAGYKYHGRVEALIQTAREDGLMV